MSNEDYDELPLDVLHLDPENPRLPRGNDWHQFSEPEILREFLRRYNLVEIARSIASKGFTPRHAEALLVVETELGSERYYVVEGNRRLATLKLLCSEQLRAEAGATSEEWQQLAERSAQHDLAIIPVIKYRDRADIDDYLGFRHITGPRPWRPEAKARFIAKLLADGDDIGMIARRIGSNHRTVRRFAEAYAIYTQAVDNDIDMDQAEVAFGIFYNALDQEGIREFLGLGRQIDINNLPHDPVPTASIDNLSQLVSLLFGDSHQDLKRVISESRELKKLGQTLADDIGRISLLRDRDLDAAWHASNLGKNELITHFVTIRPRLAEISGFAAQYALDPDIRKRVKQLHEMALDMAHRYGVLDD